MIKKNMGLNAVLNMVKQLFAIIFPMITFPYASRILGAENYGRINFCSSIISYLSAIAALGISNYAITEGSKKSKDVSSLNNFINQVVTINIASTFFAYIILISLLCFWDKAQNNALILVIQSSAIIMNTLGIDWINSIHEDYLYLTIRYIVCQIISVILMFILVKSENDYVIYVFTSTLGVIMANISNILYLRRKYDIKLKISFSREVVNHLKPIFILFGTSITSLIYINSDITLLGIMIDDISVGYYSVSTKIYSLVKQVFNAGLYVTIPYYSKKIGNDENEVSQSYNNLFNVLIILLIPALTGLFVLSDRIVLLFAGSEYLRASSSLRLLSIALFFAIIACFFVSSILLPHLKTKCIFQSTVISSTLNVLLNVILIPHFLENAAAFTTLLSEITMFFFTAYFAREYFQFKLFKSLTISSMEAFGVIAICYIISILFDYTIINIVLSILISIVLCLIINILFNKTLVKSIIGMINGN